MKDLLKKIPVSTQKIIGAVLPIIIVILLFIFVGKFGITKVTDIRAKSAEAQKDQNVLTQKLSVLQSVDAAVSSGTDISISALPDSNPSLIVVSQLKILAGVNGILISNIKSGAGVVEASGLVKVDVTFDITGVRPQITAFLNSTQKLSPLMVLSRIKIVESAGETRANVVVSSFFAGLPKTLPALTDNINDLTPAEKKILTDISTLTQPLFVQIPAGETQGSANPFGE
ncbi:MAG TPA: hypothetical protein VFI61_00990 [Patescibacteria group bacterium]|nr:hypothetical protein [Patescibacteria group bacterium]